MINSKSLKQLAFLTVILFSFSSTIAQRKIEVDFNKEKGILPNVFKEGVGAGRAFEGLGEQWQNQLRQVKKDCDFTYLRFHALFHDEMDVYKEDANGNPIYNWQKTDQLFDFLLSIKMKPFVELSFMPVALRTNDQTVFHWKAYISPPKSYPKYEALIEAFVRHLEQRYGKPEVKQWYFEVWNEPNLPSFFSGSQQEYFKMYAAAAKAIKKVDPTYKVGGPASAGTQWVKETIDFTEKNQVPLDFISTHYYGVKGDLDETGNRVLMMKPDKDVVIKAIERVRQQIDETSKKGLELHITEWSSSYSPLDPVHDTYQNATYVLNVLKNTEHNANSMSYWTFSDIFEELGQSDKPFHGGFGLMTINDLKKPTYFAYKYLNQLGKTELLNKDSASWVCKTDENVQLLLWNFTYSNQNGLDNARFYTQDIPSKTAGNTTINIKNLVNGKYHLLLYKTGYKQNDIYTAYAEMGRPEKLSFSQIEKLKSLSTDAPTKSKKISVKNGEFTYNVNVNENDVYFLKLVKTN